MAARIRVVNDPYRTRADVAVHAANCKGARADIYARGQFPATHWVESTQLNPADWGAQYNAYSIAEGGAGFFIKFHRCARAIMEESNDD